MADEKNDDKPLTESAAIQSDTLWGGPQWIDAATPDPVFVTTKKQYFDLLNSSGWRMKDQQESTTGPELPPAEPEVRLEAEVKPLTKEEAHVLGAVTAVFRRYGLIETVWCEECFSRNRHHGCQVIVNEQLVLIRCRCGVAEYKPPVGTTDLVLNKLANTAIVELDKTTGTIMTATGPVTRPTTVLQDMEALILYRYVKMLSDRGKEPRIFHKGCYQHNPTDEDNAMAMNIGSNDTVMFCQCRMLVHRRRRIDEAAPPPQLVN